QPVAGDVALEGEDMAVGRHEAVEVGKGRRLALTQIGKENAAAQNHRIALLPDALTEAAVLRLGRGLQALAVHVEQPAMERAAQAAILRATKGKIGAAMRTVAIQQSRAALLVAEQHESLS